VILSKCVFVFEIFFFWVKECPDPSRKIFKFFQPLTTKVHSEHQENGFFFFSVCLPRKWSILTLKKKSFT
jgi:hypothetical protein